MSRKYLIDCNSHSASQPLPSLHCLQSASLLHPHSSPRLVIESSLTLQLSFYPTLKARPSYIQMINLLVLSPELYILKWANSISSVITLASSRKTLPRACRSRQSSLFVLSVMVLKQTLFTSSFQPSSSARTPSRRQYQMQSP